MLNPHLISRLRRVDWDFAGSLSESPFSAIHWYPARFASQLPAALIGLLTNPGDTVLDIFVGSGTTLVESQRLGRRSIGIDLNPIACLISCAKTIALPGPIISELIQRLKSDASCAMAELRVDETVLPPAVQAKWYTRTVKRDLAKLWTVVVNYEGQLRTLSWGAFSALLLPVCRETRHWGYVCDNSTPSGNHGGNVLERYGDILDRISSAYNERDADLQARFGKDWSVESSKVIYGDARLALSKIPSGSVDLILTSPPYFGVSDYVKAQRLSMEWFRYEIEPLRLDEIGARSKRHRKRAISEYVAELGACFAEAKRCLNAAGIFVVIIGESQTRDSVFSDIISCIKNTGFELKVNLNRRVSSQRRQAPSIVGEHLLILSKEAKS